MEELQKPCKIWSFWFAYCMYQLYDSPFVAGLQVILFFFVLDSVIFEKKINLHKSLLL